MADVRKIVELYLDTENMKQVTADNFDVRDKMVLYRGTNVLFCVHLRLGDGITYFQPDASSLWNFRVDNVFTPDSPDLVVSDNDQFNVPSDWGSLDITGGKVCWRTATNTTQLAEALGSDESQTMYAELWMKPPVDDAVLVCHWEITVHNKATNYGDSSDLVYSTSNIINWVDGDCVLYFPDGSVAQRWSK